MDYSTMTDSELTAIRKSMPKYLNNMTPEQTEISHAVYAEQKKRYDENKAKSYDEYNSEVENHGFNIGDRVKYFARSMLGIGGAEVTGTVKKRKKYYVKLDYPFNGQKTSHLTSGWKLI